MLTKNSIDSIEAILCALDDYNASLEEEGTLSNLNEDFIESKLRRFDRGIFFELGQDLRKLALDPYQKSKFIVPHRTLSSSLDHSSLLSHFDRE